MKQVKGALLVVVSCIVGICVFCGCMVEAKSSFEMASFKVDSPSTSTPAPTPTTVPENTTAPLVTSSLATTQTVLETNGPSQTETIVIIVGLGVIIAAIFLAATRLKKEN